ncbi:MAG: hypothetical protein O7G83_13465 [Proteobacteria bacterium]|nr:hypothetical protein [Pseudomonadota bacterium]
MMKESEHPKDGANGRDIVAAWIVFAVVLFGLFAFSAVQLSVSDRLDANAAKEALPAASEIHAVPLNVSRDLGRQAFNHGTGWAELRDF